MQYRAKMAKAMTGKTFSPERIARDKDKWLAGLQKARAAYPHGSNYGRRMSEETKRKLSLALKGIRPKTSPEILAKISLALKGRPNPLVHGSKSPLWKHGLSATRQYIRQMKKRRTAFERGGGKLSTQTVQLVYEENIKQYGTLTCIYCLKPIEFGRDTLEHKQPLSRGGTNAKENLAVACLRCNSRKRAMTYEQFVEVCQGVSPV